MDVSAAHVLYQEFYCQIRKYWNFIAATKIILILKQKIRLEQSSVFVLLLCTDSEKLKLQRGCGGPERENRKDAPLKETVLSLGLQPTSRGQFLR